MFSVFDHQTPINFIRRCGLIIVLALLCLGTSAQAQTSMQPEAGNVLPAQEIPAFLGFYQQGKIAFDAHHYADAVLALQKALERNANDLSGKPAEQQRNQAVLSAFLGKAAFCEGDYALAQIHLESALKLYQSPVSASLADTETTHAKERISVVLLLAQTDMILQHFTAAQTLVQEAFPEAQRLLGAQHEQTRFLLMMQQDLAHIDAASDYSDALAKQSVSHWTINPAQPVRVYISDGSGLNGWTPDVRQAVKAAYGEWEKALDNGLHFTFVNQLSAADTIVNWVSAPTGGLNDIDLRSGYCHFRYEADGTYSDNRITIALTSADGQPVPENALHNTLLHEIEHSLGVDGVHSNRPGDILYRNNQYDGLLRRQLSARDINTVKALYQLKATRTNPIGINLVRYAQKLHPTTDRLAQQP